ncbi:hypothetical protein [Aridibaculum aurantiacum]|uniref:hypothetical protein n=1 Tax=Aridibaculum aurantiacum TaxID=2810307 RepID=UPI001A968EF0|nr:hypothetical protein [Aridibaculum aurantiacum]
MRVGSSPGKHLYSRGWFGLIPLIGGFVGLGLIVLGIFKYKDRKLILIGSAALLFTVVIYSSMIYYFEYSTTFREDFAVFSQPKMDELIKSIEFYKTENAQYPDSLQELTNKNEMVQIYDPISQREGGENGGDFITSVWKTNTFCFQRVLIDCHSLKTIFFHQRIILTVRRQD